MEFVKFPDTPYIWDGRVRKREERQLSPKETEEVFSKPVLLQEKVDGTNIGLRRDIAGNVVMQHRGDFVRTLDKESEKLGEWCRLHGDELRHVLGNSRILFGEWMLFQHTLLYDRLPSYFLAFDIFDLERQRFVSQRRLNEILRETAICALPVLHEGRVSSMAELQALLRTSDYGSEPMEGLYIREDSDEFNEGRCKYVRPQFQQSITDHWRNRKPVRNKSVDSVEQYWSV